MCHKDDIIIVSAKSNFAHIKSEYFTSNKVLEPSVEKQIDDETILQILNVADLYYATNFKYQKVVFKVQLTFNIATKVLYNKKYIKKDVIFHLIKNPNKKNAINVQCALINKDDIKMTNIMYLKYGPFGKTNKCGLYDIKYGILESSYKDKKFWDNYVYLINPSQLFNYIMRFQDTGIETKHLIDKINFFNGESPFIDLFSIRDDSAVYDYYEKNIIKLDIK